MDGKGVERDGVVWIPVEAVGLVEDAKRDGKGDGNDNDGGDDNTGEALEIAMDKEAARIPPSPLPPSPPPSEPPSPSHNSRPLPALSPQDLPPADLPPPDLPPQDLPSPDLPPPDLDPSLKALQHSTSPLPPTTAIESQCLPLLPAPSNWRLSTSTDRDSGSNYYYYPSYWTCCACNGGPYSGSCLVDCSVCGHRECVHCVEF
jgi:hypothetical protein